MKSFVLEGPGGIPGLKQLPSGGSVTTNSNWIFGGNVTISGTLSAASESITSEIITTANANAFAVGPAGTTNPTFNVDTSTASAATGLNVKSAAAGSRVALSVLSSASNESMSIDAKGTGQILMAALNAGETGVQIGDTATLATAVLTVKNQNALGFAVGLGGATNPAFSVDTSTASSATGVNVKSAAAAGGVAVTVTSSGTDENLTIDAKGAGTVTLQSAVVAAAGGAQASGVRIGSIGVGFFTGTGAPTFSAMNGSVYVDSNATTTTTRIYVNKSGAGTAGTTWTNLTTAA